MLTAFETNNIPWRTVGWNLEHLSQPPNVVLFYTSITLHLISTLTIHFLHLSSAFGTQGTMTLDVAHERGDSNSIACSSQAFIR